MGKTRTERDSLGEVTVPADALWGAQTQRAVDNFSIAAAPMPEAFVRALARIKQMSAEVNAELGLLPQERAQAIAVAAASVAAGEHLNQFPVPVYQTGSGTSSNMNANEVIARLAGQALGQAVHPNDEVNLGQSSNDVVPSALRVGAVTVARLELVPALEHLKATIERRANDYRKVIKTGRTHLMDATPISMGQEFDAWAALIGDSLIRIDEALASMCKLPLGGTAVGTGLNADPRFARRVCERLSESAGCQFTQLQNLSSGMSAQGAPLQLSAALRDAMTAVGKVAEDLRWMNSGPLAGLAELQLPALQPGSSIMPGKVNPVICEAVLMAMVQVGGLDQAIARACGSGHFQLNVMLPLIAANLDQSMWLTAGAARTLADLALRDLTVNEEHLARQVRRNPILVTALNPVVGYEKAAQIAKQAYASGRPVIEVAAELTDLSESELERLLDPSQLI